MATVTTAPGVPSVIRQKLRRLRMRLAGWILVDGVAWLFMVATMLVLFDMLVDRVFKMDFSQRLIMLCLMIVGLLVVVYFRMVRPWFRIPSDDALILQVEDKNQQLNESLISSVQLSRTDHIEDKGMSIPLWEATIRQGIEKARSVNFASALNAPRSIFNWIVLVIGILATIGIGVGVANGGFLQTWFNRNILLLDDSWPQNTYLVFIDPDSGEAVTDQTIVVARGSDFRQLVRVDGERSKTLKVVVTLELEDGSKKRTRIKMKNSGRSGDLDHVTIFRNASDEFRMRASGGDDITEWIRVTMVEPPAVDNLQLTVNLPKYIGDQAQLALKGSGPHSVLKGSTLDLLATVNKPLRSAQLKLGGEAMDLKATANPLVFSLSLPGEGELRGGKYEFFLVDEAGKASIRPVSFSIRIAEDKPPVVRASLVGISGLILPRAYLPVSFSATDQYRLTKTAFHYAYKGSDNSVPVEKTIDIPLQKEFPDSLTVKQNEILDLRPENIPVGVTLRLNVHAWDNQPDNPEPGSSREFLLRVVSEEELRADLLRREVEQRNIFQQAYNDQLELQADLRALAAARPVQDPDAAKQKQIIEDFFDDRENQVLAMLRRQKMVGTNIAAVADRFQAFLIEAQNNRLDESEKDLDTGEQQKRTFKDRVTNDIVNPIIGLDREEIVAAGQGIDNSRRVTRTTEFAVQIEETAKIQETILDKMRLILKAMEDTEAYQQLVNQLVEIKKLEESLIDLVDQEKDKPNKTDGIFDDDKKDDGGKSGKKKK